MIVMLLSLQLQILFDDSLTATYEYPSEQSLMAETPAQPGDVDYEGDHVHTSGLLVTPSIVAAGLFSSDPNHRTLTLTLTLDVCILL